MKTEISKLSVRNESHGVKNKRTRLTKMFTRNVNFKTSKAAVVTMN